MADANFWWILVIGLIIVELFTGTFYLLMLAVGAAAGAIAAYAGAPMGWQQGIAAMIGIKGIAALYYIRKKKQGLPQPAQDNPNLHLDIGQSVHIAQWNVDGSAHVLYRGSTWQVKMDKAAANEAPQLPGQYIISSVQGNTLLVQPSA